MIQAYSRALPLGIDGIVSFNSVVMDKGCADAIVGTSTIQLNKAGIYKIEFHAEALAVTAGTVAFAMSVNGVEKAQDTTSITGATTTSTVTVPIVTLVQVRNTECKCSCKTEPTTIQFENIGVATVSDVNVVVTKVC